MTQTVPRKKKKPSLVLVTVRVILVLLIVVLALFLGAGWYFSNEIRSGALEPATAGPESYDWSVVDAAAAVTLESSVGTD